MTTQSNRKKSVIAVLGTTIAAVLLTLSAAVAHAAPDDGTDSSPPPAGTEPGPQPLHVHVSENPVLFAPFEDAKTVTVTWTPQFDSIVAVNFFKNGEPIWIKIFDEGSSGPVDLLITYGNSVAVAVCKGQTTTMPTCPLTTITTAKAEPLVPPLKPIPIPIPIPQPPGINTPLVPKLPDLPVR